MSGGRAFVDITMSLDGFITGPNGSVESPLGEGGGRLHQQYLSKDVTHLQIRPPKTPRKDGGAP